MRRSGARSDLAAASSVLDGRPLRERIRARARSSASRQTLGAERLQQVVDRVHLERPNGIAVVRGDEDDGDVAADQLEHVEPVELRHLDVEHQQIGFQLGGGLHGLETVRALGHDLDVGDARQPLAQDAARKRLVVHNHDANASAR